MRANTSQPDTIDEVLNRHAQEFKAGHLDKVKAALSAMVAEIVGEDVKYLRGRSFPMSEKIMKNAAIRIENELRGEQRQRAIAKGFTLEAKS
ncbi:hypothetical protein QFZ70_001485 [Arthrobacter sp. V1I9]|uniref:hypothetical protein n=1 Tax=Arthrobacter sp. V1I9 TaxID=3042275 RepID=UPI00278D8334|nr:hypothetical protein [Arthrobacter sp. V1I9]MDQ0869012.1 hypothetical protein [Arthrobacter sp. V1I9]